MQFNVNYPDHLPDALQETPEQFEKDAKMAMAVKLYEIGKLSSGMAAELVGILRTDFLYELHKYGVAIHDLSEKELESDIENA